MGELKIFFTEPSPAPSQYKVRYKLTTTSTWQETTVAGPPPLLVTGTTSQQEYDVEVYSDCGSGVFSTPDTDIAPWAECDSYTFRNDGASPATLTYGACGYNTTSTVVTLDPGETFGPVCIVDITSISGFYGFIMGAGIVIIASSSNCTTISPTGT